MLLMPALGIALSVAGSTINGLWAYRLLSIGRKERSPALIADGKHLLADVVSSGGIVAGVLATVLTGWLWLDPLVAALAGIYILSSGWRLIKESVGDLMDRSASPETVARIRACIAKEAEGAIEAHDLKTRLAGPALFVEFHLVVPAAMTVSDAHEICDRIESALRQVFPGARVTIHVEPENKAKHTGVVIRP
jgi:cation diffusion facilitator family transporter